MSSNNVAKGKKIASIVGICLATLLVIFAFCGRYFNDGLKQFGNFFLGAFGMSFYGLMAAVIVACSFTLAGKSVKIPAKYIVGFILLFVSVVLFVHLLTTTYLPKVYFNEDAATGYGYVQLVYHYYDSTFGMPTFGGVVFGSVAFALEAVLTIYGAIIIVLALMMLAIYLVGDYFYSYFTRKLPLQERPSGADIEPSTQTTSSDPFVGGTGPDSYQRAYNILFEGGQVNYPEEISTRPTVERYDVSPQSEIDAPYRQPSERQTNPAAEFLFGQDSQPQSPQQPQQPTQPQQSFGNGFFKPRTESPVPQQDETPFITRSFGSVVDQRNEVTDELQDMSSSWIVPTPHDTFYDSQDDSLFRPVVQQERTTPVVTPVTQVSPSQPIVHEDSTKPIVNEAVQQPIVTQTNPQPVAQPVSQQYDVVDVVMPEDTRTETIVSTYNPAPYQPISEVVEDEDEEVAVPQVTVPQVDEPHEEDDDDEIIAVETQTRIETATGPAVQTGMDFMTRGELKEKEKKVHKYMKYNKPAFDLLNDATIVEDTEAGERQRNADAIIAKLAVFGIKIELGNIVVGPTVTRYMFNVLSARTRMSDFKQYSDDIKACIEAKEDIRIEAPVHGTNMVGFEVANRVKSPVVLRTILESKEFQRAKGNLVFAIGQEISGKMMVADLADMPHLLIAGTTGSGKSVCLNSMIVSLMYKYGPEYLRFLMVDPKYVELSRYNGIPHMLTAEAITETKDALAGMDYLIAEMESRYQLFKSSGVGNISEYNEQVNTKLAQKMPYLVFVVDELADLMASSKKLFEAKLVRLAQKSRAAGIHIVLATQRPDTSVITGTIKANLPNRMALKVASQYDSTTIINGGGAEKLLGKGDMLFMSSSTPDLERIQGAYVGNNEIRDLVKYLRESNEIYYDDSITDQIFVSRKPEEDEPEQDRSRDAANKETQLDPLCKQALTFWLEKNGGKASIASIQRNLNIGFNRAGRIMDSLQKMKYVEEPSASDTGSKQLHVLVTIDELDSLFPDTKDE